MIKFKFEDQHIEMPTSWDEVKVHHFINPYFLSGNSLLLMSSLSGIPVKKLATTTEDVAKKFEKTTAFLADNPHGWRSKEIIGEIKFMDVMCPVPKNIEAKMFGQKIMLGQALQKAKFLYEAIPEAVAIYFGPYIFDDWYEPERLELLKTASLELPIQDVYPIVNFFLNLSRKDKPTGKRG